ncbi:MAG: serine hydrolase [Microscillaceae bacterium]|nr:serine hydrolase [Microscillaceae bacterium]
MSFYILKRIADKFLPLSLDSFVQKQFYEPMGMYRSGYLPLERLPLEQIPPTEQDTYFRQQLVHGFVHDQGAAMLGGVAGHAGLFANALDLAKYMQMQLQGGHYGGQVFFRDSTTRLFQKPFIEKEDLLMLAGNRRGLGWDRKDAESYSYIPDPASDGSFGHSGFTGCVVWADPKTQLVMVFLSNRIHPSAENTQLITAHWRRKILNLAYAALIAPQ